jgi:hypothetical protein
MSLLFTITLSAASNARIKLPDGLYMYDSWISHAMGASVRFEKFFVVKNNDIYFSEQAIKKFGLSKLNESFTKNKKYKILLCGEKVGKIDKLKVDNEDAHKAYIEDLFSENIKEVPIYKEESYPHDFGSAASYIAVPEKYKEGHTKVSTTISKDEIDRITKLAQTKLLSLVKKRKETREYKITGRELDEERLNLLDKISDSKGYVYIGVYRFRLELGTCCPWAPGIAFSVRNDDIHIIATDVSTNDMKICGMLDVDGDGEEELIIKQEYHSEDESTLTLDIYKQKADGGWIRIYKLKSGMF